MNHQVKKDHPAKGVNGIHHECPFCEASFLNLKEAQTPGMGQMLNKIRLR